MKKWIALNEDYYIETDDVAYWHSERTSLSFFAGAVWRTKNIVLEEYPCTKGRGDDKWDGRADICFTCGKQWIVAEAKQRHSNLSKFLDNGHAEYCESAQEDIKYTRHGEKGSIPLSLTFIVPYCELSKRNTLKTLEETPKALSGIQDAAFYAYYLPSLDEIPRGARYYYPLVLLIGLFL